MGRVLVVRLEAEADIESAVVWYERQVRGLGARFLDALDDVQARIGGFPLHFPEVAPDVRRALLRRFPYAIYFVAQAERVVVIAVLHQHRSASTWTTRAPQAALRPGGA